MDNKIEYLTCKNFKFFYGCDENDESNKLVLNRKNLLLYGENGSGKSSIYWALYTILQSSIKQEDNDVHKYFEANDAENLRNRFSEDSDMSSVSICFSDDRGRIRTWEISNMVVSTLRDEFMTRTLFSSDFINYSYLTKFYNFRNSQNIDLFPMFERDLFKFINFSEAYRNEKDIILTDKTLAEDWWNYILATPKNLPRNKNTVSVSSLEYLRFKNSILPRFCNLLKNYLNSIIEKANSYLKDEFNCPFRLKFNYDKLVCDYNKPIGVRSKDGKFYKPKIELEVEYIHSLLNTEKQKVFKPQSFLNEAKLTSIALSIRLAMLDEKMTSKDSGKILVLDDLLISLDMSNRDTVLDIILKKRNIYQLLILTHDRAFYNIAKLRIENSKDSDWVFKEMYCKQQRNEDIPIPMIINPKSYLNCAYKYLYEFDYPACANYLRKESERVLCKLLPQNLTIIKTNEGDSKPAMLEMLIKNFKNLCHDLAIDISFSEKLFEYKNILLNPLSHDNIKSPIYKQELISCISILEELNKFNRQIIANVDIQANLFFMIDDSDGFSWQYKIQPKEMFFYIVDGNNNKHFNNPNSLFISRKQNGGDEESLNIDKDLYNGMKMIYHKIKKELSDKHTILNDVFNQNRVNS